MVESMDQPQHVLVSVPESRSHGIELVNGAVYEFHKPVPGQRVEVEIVFMHGLQLCDYKEAYWKTWRMRDGSSCWLDTLLAKAYPNARTLSLSYDSCARKTATTGNISPMALAKTLLHHMLAPNVMLGQNDCPVVFVCHSFGGIIAKQIVVEASDPSYAQDMRYQNLLNNIKAFFFFATPHGGSKMVDSTIVKLAKRFVTTSSVVDYLKVLSNEGASLHDKFLTIRSDKFNKEWKLYVVAEGSKTNKLGISEWVVEPASARCGDDREFVTLANVDHFTVCKPESETDGGFQHLMKCINTVIDEHKSKKRREEHLAMNRGVTLSETIFGLDSMVLEVQGILHRDDISIVGLVGMGGSGKTTLSKVVYNAEVRKYEKSCYLEKVAAQDIRDVLKQLYRDLFGKDIERKVEKIHRHEIRRCFEEKKVLVVVDDVEAGQKTLEELQMCGLEGSASKVIVTCRNQDVLKSYSMRKSRVQVVKVQGIKDEDGSDMKMFCNYAFDGVEENEREGFRSVAKEIVDYCEGLPLSLEVMGQYLYEQNYERDVGKRMALWDDAMKSLRKAKNVEGGAHDSLWSCLRTSYSSLGDDEQDFFLAFACFFSEMPWLKRGSIERIWGKKNVIQHLINRSLIKGGGGDEGLSIHNQLRDLGRKILKDKNGVGLCGQIYLCGIEKVLSFLRECESSTSLRGLSLVATVDRRLHGVFDRSDKWKRLDLQSWASETVDQSSHQHYPYLRFLILVEWNVGAVLVERCLSKCSKRLRWLCLQSSTISSNGLQNVWLFKEMRVLQLLSCDELVEIPDALCDLIHLVELQVHYSGKLKRLPIRMGNLMQLEKLDLRVCFSLATIPDIAQLLKLEYLSFRGCRSLTGTLNFEARMDNLREVHIESTGLEAIKGLSSLHNLQALDASYCESLRTCDLPGSLGKLLQLQTLNLCRCQGLLREVAEAFRNEQLQFDNLVKLVLPCFPETGLPPCPRLKVLKLDNGLNQPTIDPDMFSNTPMLEWLEMSDCFINSGGVKELPSSLWTLVRLEQLFLGHFQLLENLPESVKQLEALQSLHVYRCGNLARIPMSLGDLPNLSLLSLHDCLKVDWNEASHSSLRKKLLERSSLKTRCGFEFAKLVELEQV